MPKWVQTQLLPSFKELDEISSLLISNEFFENNLNDSQEISVMFSSSRTIWSLYAEAMHFISSKTSTYAESFLQTTLHHDGAMKAIRFSLMKDF